MRAAPAPAAQVAELERRLNDFDPEIRRQTLTELVGLVERGAVVLPPPAKVANMHCHTFFSFNAYGLSPASLAWLARRRGFKLLGIVDFDVLDGVDEFLDACEAVGVCGSAGIETRAFIPEYAAQVINSPGEPGVYYAMGIGFASGSVPGAAAGILADLGSRAAERNRAIVGRLNAYLAPAAIDYERDVLPLTPAGNPTERHIVVALLRAAERTVPDRAAFWADKLGVGAEPLAALLPDSPELQNLVRARLMKQGGAGYVQPESGMFPRLEAFHSLIIACGALPCATWLDGTSEGERDPEQWLEFLVSQGATALNIIPDRNWNIADAQVRRIKVGNLHRVVEVAGQLDLPLNVGTEMNSFGQKPVDDFDVPEMAPLRRAFLDGAHFIYGHTAMQRAAGLGYNSPWAQASLPTRRERNEFYTRLGRLVPPGRAGRERLRRIGPADDPARILAVLGEPGGKADQGETDVRQTG